MLEIMHRALKSLHYNKQHWQSVMGTGENTGVPDWLKAASWW
jgi:hypothetical protein